MQLIPLSHSHYFERRANRFRARCGKRPYLCKLAVQFYLLRHLDPPLSGACSFGIQIDFWSFYDERVFIPAACSQASPHTRFQYRRRPSVDPLGTSRLIFWFLFGATLSKWTTKVSGLQASSTKFRTKLGALLWVVGEWKLINLLELSLIFPGKEWCLN